MFMDSLGRFCTDLLVECQFLLVFWKIFGVWTVLDSFCTVGVFAHIAQIVFGHIAQIAFGQMIRPWIFVGFIDGTFLYFGCCGYYVLYISHLSSSTVLVCMLNAISQVQS